MRGAIHVQTVNANDMGWRRALDLNRIATPEQLLRSAIGTFNT